MRTKLLSALLEMVSEQKVELFKNTIQKRTKHVTVVLENIFQPHNSNAVMRTCDCFGIQDIHVIENDNEYVLNEEIALGASQWIDLHKYNKAENNTVECINTLKKKGYKVIMTTPHTDDVTIDQLPLDEPIALFFGTELTGISDLAMEHADGFVKIPMQGFTESFNISVSAALCMYDVSTRLRASDIDWQLSEEEQTEIQIDWCKQVIKYPEMVEKELLKRIAEEELS
jgi:tRNA (guanosine-2'-O-)-methyltransferase